MRFTVLALALGASLALGQGQALLTAPQGYVVIPEPTSSLTGIRTFEAWIKFTGQNPYGDVISDNCCGTPRWEVGHSVPGVFFGRWWNSSAQYADVPLPEPPVGQWQHVAITWDSATLRSFVNGQPYASVTFAGNPAPRAGSQVFWFGGAPAGAFWDWNSSIDEARAWSVVRTPAEIAASYQHVLSSGSGLVSVWHFDGNAQDSVGANSGTIQGNPTFVSPGAPIVAAGLAAPALGSIGAPIIYDLLMPPSVPYVFDVSTTGTAPGIAVSPTIHVPLNPPLLNLDFGPAIPPGVFVNFVGLSNASGGATAVVNVPNVPQLIGVNLSAAFGYLDPVAPSGIGGISNPVTTLITGPAPVITGVLPASGVQTGGTSIQIAGSSFQAGATVKIGGTPATAVVVTPTSITCVTPAGAVGPASVQVTNPDTLSTTLAGGFTYVATLVVSSVSPAAAATGTAVTVTGSGIQAGATVSVGGVAASVQTSTATSLTFTNPPGIPCSTTVVVTNPDNQVASIGFNPTPTISSIFGSSGPAAGGGSMVIFGTQFLAGTTVTVGGAAATINSQSQTSLFCTVPPGAVGPAQIAVSSLGGCTATATYTYQ
jgi:hypothetical protein